MRQGRLRPGTIAAVLGDRLKAAAAAAIVPIAPRGDLVRYGDEAGYIVPRDLLGPDSICYCVGVGDDLSFDLDLIRHHGCAVFAFDPTPRAAQHVAEHAVDVPRYHFHPWGVWSSDGPQRFYAPRDPAHVSHSVVNLQGTSDYFEAECRSPGAIVRALGHDRIDLLKLDVEGAEGAVLAALWRERIHPTVLCVDFDLASRRASPLVAAALARSIAAEGYRVVAIERWNYTLVRTGRAPTSSRSRAAPAPAGGRPEATPPIVAAGRA